MQPGLAPAPGRARDVAARHARTAPTSLTRVPDRVRRDAARRRTSSELGAGLPPDVDVMWTGPDGVLADDLRADDARGLDRRRSGDRRVDRLGQLSR